MKTLFLLRHAKADNPTTGLTDLNRALNERGKNEAQVIGTFLKKHNQKVNLVLCSTAVRARETTELVLAAAELTVDVRYDERIYETGPLRLLEVISEIEESLSVVLLVGHNPGMEELLKILTGRLERMATGTMAKIDLDVDQWRNVLQDKVGAGTFDWIVKPSDPGSG